MFGHFSNQLTKISGYYVDWSRIGELVASNSHRYSRDELLVRAGIITFTGISGYLSAVFNDQEKTGCSNITMSLIGAAFGFCVSHAIVIYPLIKKRIELGDKCMQLSTSILEKFSFQDRDKKGQFDKVSKLIEHILSASCSDEKHSRASQTWGYRHRILTKLDELINSAVIDDTFLSQSCERMVSQINQGLIVQKSSDKNLNTKN